MNYLIQRFGTPSMVLGIAVYLGWPTTSSTNYDDAVARAKSVRWRPQDLANPPDIASTIDPFREVLVTTEKTVVEPETGKLVAQTKPAGPPQSELESGLVIEGIAQMGGRHWAIINGRPRLLGDELQTSDAKRHSCEILAIEDDRVVVRCEETIATLRPIGHRTLSIAAQPHTTVPETTPPSESLEEAIPPPPGV